MDNRLDYEKLYKDQDTVLDEISKIDNGFYLTGGTCLHRFYLNKRYSDDLDFFCNDNDLFRDCSREFVNILKQKGFNITTLFDTRDFIRVKFNEHLKIDFVNDRVFRLGRTEKNPNGYKIDNVFNILTNKITAIIGRDEPKDVFDLWAISMAYNFSWKEMINYSLKKSFFEIDQFVERLHTFPVILFDKINVIDKSILFDAKKGITKIITDIMEENDNVI